MKIQHCIKKGQTFPVWGTQKTVHKAQVSGSPTQNSELPILGEQKTNLTPSEAMDLKMIKKRVKEGDMVIIPTDKSGRLTAMSRAAYREAGMTHTRKDPEVSWEWIRDSQRELNGHVSMLIKCFKIGSYWKHGYRVRETLLGDSQSVCPLTRVHSGLYKYSS